MYAALIIVLMQFVCPVQIKCILLHLITLLSFGEKQKPGISLPISFCATTVCHSAST